MYSPTTCSWLIQIRRIEKGLTQRQLAIILGCCVESVIGWEGGRHRPYRGAAYRLAKALGGEPGDYRDISPCSGRYQGVSHD